MADEALNVVIGASIDGLTSGINRAKEEIEGLSAPINHFIESLSGVAEVIGAAFVFDKLKEWVEQVTEAAEKVDILSQSIGTSAESLLAWQNAARLAGGAPENILRVMQMVGRQIETGLGDPLTKQHQAIADAGLDFHALAAAMDEPLQLLNMLREAWQRLADTPGQRLDIFRNLGVGPRILTQLTPFLNQTDEQQAETKEEAQRSGANLTNEEIKALRGTREEVLALGLAWDGLKDHIVLGFKEPIDESLKSLKELVIYIKDNLPAIGQFFRDAWGGLDPEKIKKAPDYTSGPASVDQTVTKRMEEFFENQFKTITDAYSQVLNYDRSGRQPDGSVIAPVPPPDREGTVGTHLGHGTPAAHGEAVKQGAKEGVAEGLGHAATISGTHSSARENFAHFNYGNIKGKGGWNEYSGAEEGTQAIADWLVRAQENHGLNTLRQLIGDERHGYSPESDNRGKHLPEAAAAATGLDLDQIIDVHDKAIQQKIVSAILKQEGAPAAAFATAAAGGAGGAEGGAHRTDPKKDYEAFEANEKKKLALAHGDYAAQIAIDDERLAHVVQLYSHEGEAAAKASKQYQEIETHKIGLQREAADEQNRIDMAALETARRVENEKEAALLRGIEIRRTSGAITIDSATTAELKIVADHKAAVEKILADEYALTEGRKKEYEKVVNIAQQAEEKIALDKKKIQEKSDAEHLQNAIAIDKKIATDAASGIVSLAWGKSTPGQALASTAQHLETQALDKVFERVLTAAGVGKAFDKLFSTIEEKIFGKVVDKGVDAVTKTAVDAPVQAAATATALAPLITVGGPTATALALTPVLEAQTAQIVTGLGALFLKPSFLGTSLFGGGIIPSAAAGMTVNDGRGGTLAIVHPNEMVLPSHLSQGIQTAISAGNFGQTGAAAAQRSVALHYSPTIHAPETPNLKQTLNRHGGDMLNWMQAQFRSGALRVHA